MDLTEYLGHMVYRSIVTTNFKRRIEWRKILEWLDPKDYEKILDVACGEGILSLKIAERGCQIHGVDISEHGINCANRLAQREKISAQFEVGNAEHLPYPDGYFDKVVCSSSLEHFQRDIDALREINRVLKLNGIFILTTDSFLYLEKSWLEEHRKAAKVVNYYTRQRLREKLQLSGFNMLRSEYLHKSPPTSFFTKIGVKIKWSGLLWICISLLAYPLCLLSERLFRAREIGYALIAEARKGEGGGSG